MRCELVTVNGVSMAVCGRRSRAPAKLCERPGCGYVGTVLCDFPVTRGNTCDTRVCREHARTVGPNVDHCWKHPVQAALRMDGAA